MTKANHSDQNGRMGPNALLNYTEWWLDTLCEVGPSYDPLKQGHEFDETTDVVVMAARERGLGADADMIQAFVLKGGDPNPAIAAALRMIDILRIEVSEALRARGE